MRPIDFLAHRSPGPDRETPIGDLPDDDEGDLDDEDDDDDDDEDPLQAAFP